MLSRVQKWGNSQGIRFTRQVLEQARLSVGDEVEIRVDTGRIVVEPSGRIRGRYKLEDLVAGMPEGLEAQEEDWGRPVGKEVW